MRSLPLGMGVYLNGEGVLPDREEARTFRSGPRTFRSRALPVPGGGHTLLGRGYDLKGGALYPVPERRRPRALVALSLCLLEDRPEGPELQDPADFGFQGSRRAGALLDRIAAELAEEPE